MFNCLAAVALTVRSIQLGLGSISKELTEDKMHYITSFSFNNTTSEDCGNICPEKLNQYDIEQCLGRSMSLTNHGRIFLRK